MTHTLIEMLERGAREHARRPAFLFNDEAHTFGDVWRRVNRFGAWLLNRGLLRGDRVTIVLSNGPDFFTAFYGVQRAGGIPVPLNPESGPQRIAHISAHAGARLLVAGAENAPALAAGQTPIIGVADCPEPAGAPVFPNIEAEDICFIQYTSGSTGDPKGVLLSHRNLLANLDQIIAGLRITAKDVFVSWLPLSHDMGLILMSMVPFYLAARLVLLPARLTNVQPWLRAIERYRGTFTAAPDFAYRFCVRYLREPERYDLGSLRVALDAAEPVHAETLRAFERRFGLENVLLPCYGLAEASVGVSAWIPGRPVRVDANGTVSVGPPLPGMEVRIADVGVGSIPPHPGPSAEGDVASDSNQPFPSSESPAFCAGSDSKTKLPPGQPGAILLRGPSITRGYYNNPEATARLAAGDGFIHSDDLGYLDPDGNLYIAGRLKDIIIHAGRNIAPREAEEILDGLAFVRQCAALGIDKGGMEGEQVYLFAEVRLGRRRPAEMAREIVQRFYRHFGFRPGRVYLVSPHGIPRTANGKLRHSLLKECYLQGKLREEGLILYPDY